MTTKSIIDHNNAAVAQMEQQDMTSAIDNAVTALLIHREQIGAGDTSCGDGNSSIDQCMLLTDSNIVLGNDKNRTFIYGHGIPIPDTLTDCTVISAIVLFNLALAHQLWANSSNSPSKLLVKARQLYELSYQLHKKVQGDVLFPFAVINNLAVIEQRLGNTAKSMAHFDFLASWKRIILNEGESR